MTHHIQGFKEVAEDYIKKIRSNKQTFEKTTCSFCNKSANQFGTPFDETIFVPIKGKVHNGKQAMAIYCPPCLSDDKRVKDIKRAFTITQTKAGDLIPEHVPLRNLKDDEEPEEEKADVGSNKRVEGDQVTFKDKATDELSKGTTEEKKPVFSSFYKIIKKDE